ncbi:Cytoplasmic tRNA 2-thiolation protein 2 [Cytospora paraplurivora]|uniref:Cytoplasmic tRNA 2-thiolation protein 2 n=1 Tax=Cytospora paraplurivora TaxID=2898453 RepID=A0AAN9UA97_9PEZI
MKAVKRLEVLGKEIGAAPTQTKKIFVGLSFGASSASLVNMLDESIQNQLKKRPTPAYEPVIVHVDTDLSPAASGTATATDDSSDTLVSSPPSQRLLDRFSERYPGLRFARIPMTAILRPGVNSTIDWSALPIAPSGLEGDGHDGRGSKEELRDFFARLPSNTSRADVTRLFVRHILVSTAVRDGAHALLLGDSTTALAELTLGETAKGRGFSLPWMVGDGPQTIRYYNAPRPREGGAAAADGREAATGEVVATLPIYYPLREIFRNELVIYTGLVTPPLTELLVSPETGAGSAVVSHKDVSIDDVMSRYFQDVEENYPSIVANVVRTTAKLERLGAEHGEACCGLCGMGLDELGDERWRGEIGDDGGGEYGQLCYGCQRAMRN